MSPKKTVLWLTVWLRLLFWEFFTFGKYRGWASLRLDRAISDMEAHHGNG